MGNDELIKTMLEKADAYPFYFGGDEESFFWRVAVIDDELFAERVYFTDDDTVATYFSGSIRNRKAMRNIYNYIIIDFVVYYYEDWLNEDANGAFEEVADSDDEGLCEILAAFGKKYGKFIKDVIYWSSVFLETAPDDEGRYWVSCSSEDLSEDDRLVKKVLDRLCKTDSIEIATDDASYHWDIVKAHNEIWFYRIVNYIHDDYMYITEEYGHVSLKDEYAMESLRDAVRGCFYAEGCELLSEQDDGLEAQLAIIDLNLEELTS